MLPALLGTERENAPLLCHEDPRGALGPLAADPGPASSAGTNSFLPIPKRDGPKLRTVSPNRAVPALRGPLRAPGSRGPNPAENAGRSSGLRLHPMAARRPQGESVLRFR